ncbi:hypothetical protein DL95DRAFT_405607 [Leptodontidium sp. 2 PMI_412]|nr:hypothetical protein DL95DRAFT_405607 [Leptodontidium sp. 2 PMI_412]
MSSPKTTQKHPPTISSLSSSSSLPLKQHSFSASSSSSSSSSPSPIAEVRGTYIPLKQRRKNRRKDEGRWFPTPRPRYNSDGKKLSQGSSYPYPSGGNRLPFLKREEEVEEFDAVWRCEKDRERDDRRERDPLAGTETKKGKDKGKGKEKMVERKIPDGTREEDYDTTLRKLQSGRMQLSRKTTSSQHRSNTWWRVPSSNWGSKRDLNLELPKGSRTTTRRCSSSERKHFEENQEPQQHQHEQKSFSQNESFEYQDQQREDNESDIEYVRLDDNPNARPPFFTASSSSYACGPSASHLAMFFSSRDFGEPLVGMGSYSGNFQDGHRSFSFGMQAAPVHPQVHAMSLFASLELNENLSFTNHQDIVGLWDMCRFSARYSPWSGQLPAALNNYQSFVAELKRSVLPRLEANEQFMNDLDAERSRLMCELSVLPELEGPLLRLLEATRMQYWDGSDDFRVLAVEEYDRLRAYRGMLLERLREVEYEMDDGLDLDQLSLEEDDEQYRPHEPCESSCHLHHKFDSDEYAVPSETEGHEEMDEVRKARREATTQLEGYNRSWAEILSRPPRTSLSTSTALARPISIPYPSVLNSSSSPETPETETTSQAWASHAFFCHAFNLNPYLEPPPPNSPLSPPQPAFSTSGSRESQIRDLTGLTNQLKMEKVRWHEDRLTSVFGAVAAREERAKTVWGVVIDLKRGVDEALELLERG